MISSLIGTGNLNKLIDGINIDGVMVAVTPLLSEIINCSFNNGIVPSGIKLTSHPNF